MKHLKSNGGFSLIELSIIVAVMGILTAGLLSSNNVKRETRNLDTYEDHSEEIDAAITQYWKTKGFLPCPASGTIAPNTATFGKTTDCNAAAPSGTTDVTPASGATTDALRIGVVPTRSLGLPDDYMYDKWGDRITYVTIKQLAKTSSAFDGFSTGLTTGVIEVRDAADAVISGGSTDDITAYLLLSHGKDKKGAFTKQGGVGIACGTTELDRKNCDNNAIFTQSAITDKTQGATFYYDLIKTKSLASVTADGEAATSSSSSSSSSTSSSTSSTSSSSSGSYVGGYFVMISQAIDNTYLGNKGGLTGGNAQCLDALQTYEWKFKSEANTRGLLTAAKVKWFNCSTTTCQMPLPNMTYRMAIAGDSLGVGAGGGADRVNHGGHEIITDDQGRGPGDTLSWTTSDKFGFDQGQWISNIRVVAGSSGAMWDTVPQFTDPTKTCQDYTSSNSSLHHSVADWDMTGPGPSGRFEGKWNNVTTHTCNTRRAFICFVNP